MDGWRDWMRWLVQVWPTLVTTKQLCYLHISYDLLGLYCVQTTVQAESKQRNSEYLIGLLFITEALVLQLNSFLQLIGSNELLYNRIYATNVLIVIITSQYWHCNCDWRCTFKCLTSKASVMRKKTPNFVKWNFTVTYQFLNTTAWPTCCQGVVRAGCSLRTKELRLPTQLACASCSTQGRWAGQVWKQQPAATEILGHQASCGDEAGTWSS